MSTGKLPRRFIVVRIELGEVSDHEATKLGDQLVEFAGAVAEHVEILKEGVSPSGGVIVCPNCGNDTFQEHGTMQFRQPVSLKRGDDGTLEVADYTSASEPLDELSEPAGVECAHCLHALHVCDYRSGSAPRRRRMRQLINGYCGAPDDPESDLSDAMADICHLAVSRGIDPDELTGRALSHFHAEQQPEDWVPCAPDDITEAQRDAMSTTAGAYAFSAAQVNRCTGAIRFTVIVDGGTGRYYVVSIDGAVSEQD